MGGLLAFGIPTRALKLNAENNSGLLKAVYASFSAVGALLAGSAVWFSGLLQMVVLQPVVAAALFVTSEILHNSAQAILYGTSEIRAGDLVSVSRRATPLVVAFALLATHLADIFIGLAVGYAVAALIALLTVQPTLKAVGSWRLLVKGEGRHFWASELAAMFQQLDVIIIARSLGFSAVGVYAGAFRLSNPPHLITGVIVSIAAPRVAKEKGSRQSATIRRVVLIAAVYTFFLAILSPVMFVLGPLLLGESFYGWGLVFCILMGSTAASATSQVIASVLNVLGDPRLVARATAFSTGLGLTMTAIGALGGSLVAAALGGLIAQVCLLLFYAVTVRKRRLLGAKRMESNGHP